MLCKEVSSTIFFFQVFGMMRPGIEPRSPGPLANTLPTRPMSQLIYREHKLKINFTAVNLCHLIKVIKWHKFMNLLIWENSVMKFISTQNTQAEIFWIITYRVSTNLAKKFKPELFLGSKIAKFTTYQQKYISYTRCFRKMKISYCDRFSSKLSQILTAFVETTKNSV